VPFTYFAHQTPVLPLKRWAPDRWDGLGLVVGSIVPDLHYVTSGWLFGPFGQPMWSDGHRLDLIVQNCVLPGFVLTVLLRRWVTPVVPAVLPKGGFLRLRDYRLLALSRHRWWVTAYSVLVGALTHLGLDEFTSADEHGSYDRQIVGSAVLGVAGVLMLRQMARKKWLWTWHGYEGRRPPDPVVRGSGAHRVWAALVVGTVASAGYTATRLDDGVAPSLMAFSWGCIVTLLVAGLVGRRFVEPLPPALPAAVDPLVE